MTSRIADPATMIKKFQTKYPDLDFSNSIYKGCREMMTAICSEHGKVTKTPAHWNVNGCPHCGREKCANPPCESMAKRVSGFRENASKKNKQSLLAFDTWSVSVQDKFEVVVGYTNERSNIRLRCKRHNFEFDTKFKTARKGQIGCKFCVGEKISAKRSGSPAKLLSLCKQRHGDLYDYSLSDFTQGRHVNIDIICKKHGKFNQSLHNHIAGNGCPMCRNVVSKPENEIANFIESLGVEIVRRDRSVISPKELDIFIPSKNIAVELNGSHWHADDRATLTLAGKHDLARSVGVKVIHIFDDEWLFNQDAIKHTLAYKLSKCETAYARKCVVCNVDASDAKLFLNKYHVQGYAHGRHYGLTYNEELVAVLSVGKSRFEKDALEIIRFASKVRVVGGFSKLFSHFVSVEHPSTVVSYADLRFGDGLVYSHAGFTLVGKTPPDYWWFKKQVRIPRYQTQKHKLKSDPRFSAFYKDELSESEICIAAGYRKISGVGHNKWLWKTNA